MKIINKKPIPIYESVCPECKSRFRYKKVETSWQHIRHIKPHFTYRTCPVCGMSNWASITPVAYECEEENDEKNI